MKTETEHTVRAAGRRVLIVHNALARLLAEPDRSGMDRTTVLNATMSELRAVEARLTEGTPLPGCDPVLYEFARWAPVQS